MSCLREFGAQGTVRLRERYEGSRGAVMGWAVLTPGAEAKTSLCRLYQRGFPESPCLSHQASRRGRHGILITSSRAVRQGVPVAARHRACGTSMATTPRNVHPEETETAEQHLRHDTRLSRQAGPRSFDRRPHGNSSPVGTGCCGSSLHGSAPSGYVAGQDVDQRACSSHRWN